jgi:predicted nuclease with RNAse H fold
MSSKKKKFKVIKFAGLTLGGGKGRKTCLAIIEYYVKEKKLFLSQLYDKIEESEKLSADSKIVQILEKHKKELHSVAIDAPLKMPKCMRCRLKCPGHEKCQEPEIKWMWKWHKNREPSKRPNKIFTPYTERCVEQYISSEIQPDLATDHALGSNRAPLAARAMYLKRRIKDTQVIEVMPKVSLWRLGQEMGVSKAKLLKYKTVTHGPEIRQIFLDRWTEGDLSFIYHRDFKLMVKDAFAFESFIAAYTAFLKSKGLCEKRPKGFPKSEAWIAIPK